MFFYCVFFFYGEFEFSDVRLRVSRVFLMVFFRAFMFVMDVEWFIVFMCCMGMLLFFLEIRFDFDGDCLNVLCENGMLRMSRLFSAFVRYDGFDKLLMLFDCGRFIEFDCCKFELVFVLFGLDVLLVCGC